MRHSALYVGIFENKHVFRGLADGFPAGKESQFQLVSSRFFRGDRRESSERGQARLAFRFLLVAGNFFAVRIDNRNFNFDIFETGVVQQGELERNFGLRSADRFKTRHEEPCGNGERLGKGFQIFGTAIFVDEAAEIRAEVRPLIQHKSGNERVALEGGYLRELALRREPFGIGVERAEVLPDGEILVGDKGFDLLEELPNGLAVF